MALKIFIVLAAALVVASGARPAFVQCEDSSLCPDGATCCKIDDETWGCCPYEFGQCCKDGAHCCPLGYSCDAAQGSCVHKITQQRLFRTSLERRVSVVGHRRRNEMIPGESQVGNVRCPDGNYCLDGQTCCLLTSGRYGCCPYQHAECCSDHTSCCPEGYRCRISTHQCVHATTNHTVAMVQKVSPIAFQPGQVDVEANGPAANNVRCPDGNYCLDGQTCCLLASGHYGCCPYQHAECCSDHTSCCPEGYRCRISTHQCVHAKTNHTVAMVQKVRPVASEAVQVEVSANGLLVENVRCPDGSYCLDGQTCCLLTSGRYGCCPYQHAECCSDHTSCCPEGYRCRISTHQCVHAATNHTVAMVQKVRPVASEPVQVEVSANEMFVENVRCPDGSYCLDGQTCCLLTSGRYGCCPYQHAECCSDHTSCCPEGYLCKISTHQCIHTVSNHTVPMVRKVEPVGRLQAKPSVPQVDAELLPCPDGSHCQNTQTCCLLNSGRYGCCPYAHAECCSDHSSCCPEGYRCKVSTQQCVHATSNRTVAMLKKVASIVPEAAELSQPKSDGIACPDGHKCLNGQTCCELSSGHYGCCPLPEAVCCSDHQTCCPRGYQCRVATQTCQLLDHTVPAVRKLPAFTDAALIGVAAELLKCPDGSYCQNTQTCCLLTSGHYGCCPYAHAQCCSDHTSCCPEGYRCQVSTRQCIHATRNHTVTAARKVNAVIPKPTPLSPTPNAVNQFCPDGNECDDEQTCCQLQSGSYGCCPYNQAVCCDDRQHCCPQGYTCDTHAGRCLNGNRTASLHRITPKGVSRPPNRIPIDETKTTCPDESTCPDFTTCCKSGNYYACCPLREATCCSDGQHCCPHGFDCDEVHHMCRRSRRTEDLPWLNDIPSQDEMFK